MPISAEIADLFRSLLDNLDPGQRQAVGAIAGPRGRRVPGAITIVDGPPGTGKTTICGYGAVAYLLNQEETHRSRQVVILSYTNTSSERCREVLEELGVTPDLALRLVPSNYRPPRGVDNRWYLSFTAERDLSLADRLRLRQAQILLITTYSAGKVLPSVDKPLLIFDEVSQISMGTYLTILGRSRGGGGDIERTVLVGDPAQLPVVTQQSILETNAASYLMEYLPEIRPYQLVLQYRMHPRICELVNVCRSVLRTFPLETARIAQQRTLATQYGLPGSTSSSNGNRTIVGPEIPCVPVNTDSLDGIEHRVGTSWVHQAEAETAAMVAELLSEAYAGLDLVLLSPYRAQREAMRDACDGRWPCMSVHEAQGREYDCVILSMTRTNREHDVGFLAEVLPLSYVAFSRARCKLVILISASTFKDSAFPKPIIDFLLGGQVSVVSANSIRGDERQ